MQLRDTVTPIGEAATEEKTTPEAPHVPAVLKVYVFLGSEAQFKTGLLPERYDFKSIFINDTENCLPYIASVNHHISFYVCTDYNPSLKQRPALSNPPLGSHPREGNLRLGLQEP